MVEESYNEINLTILTQIYNWIKPFIMCHSLFVFKAKPYYFFLVVVLAFFEKKYILRKYGCERQRIEQFSTNGYSLNKGEACAIKMYTIVP